MEAHAELSLLQDFAVIMAVGGIAIVLMRRLGQPSILGYLIAGVLVGPFTFDNPPVKDTEVIRLLADLGLVLLLFTLGLEFGWERIREVGLRVLFIGTVEITVMIAIGYQAGLWLGLTGTEAFFLGSALSISSSAVLVKVLRDSGQLMGRRGQLIVGILVVEDFAAVILLSLLSGVAGTDTTDAADVARLVGKLALFAGSSLVLGAIFVPRLVAVVARFGSSETLLIASLALAFGLALVAEQLGISAAAGGFLIGAILGDTREVERITRVMTPLRDMFAAIFFVSIGMLVNVHEAAEFLVPALIVSFVFIVGKIVADTVATWLTGFDGRTSISVGTGMPQVGEFSLAMVKVGADHGAVGSTLFPIITVTTAITSFIYPYVFRSADLITNVLNRTTPGVVQNFLNQISLWLRALSSSFQLKSETARRVQRSFRVIVVNVGVIAILIAVGTFLLGFVDEIADGVRIERSTVGLLIGSGVIVFCIPSAMVSWRAISNLADVLSGQMLASRGVPVSGAGAENVRGFVRDGLLATLTILLAIWMIPFVSELLALGEISVPVPVLLIAAIVFVAARSVFAAQEALQHSFAQTFLGASPGRAPGFGGPETSHAESEGPHVTPAPTVPQGSGSPASPAPEGQAAEHAVIREALPSARAWFGIGRPWIYAAALSVVVAGSVAGYGVIRGSPQVPSTALVPTVPPGEVPTTVSVTMPKGEPGPDVAVNIPESTAGVFNITFSGIPFSERAGRVVVSSHQLASADAPPDGAVVERYFRVERLDVTERLTPSGTLQFWVPARWMLLNGVLPGDIRLLALVDGGWTPLLTSPGRVTETSFSFAAQGRVSGIFAVAAEPGD